MRSSNSARWARQDSNPQPSRYERPALTVELQAPRALVAGSGMRANLASAASRSCYPRTIAAAEESTARSSAKPVLVWP
mgnify:CR=1 FL=1